MRMLLFLPFTLIGCVVAAVIVFIVTAFDAFLVPTTWAIHYVERRWAK